VLREAVAQTKYSCSLKVKIFGPGAQPGLHFGGAILIEISFDDVIVVIQPWYNFFANGHRQ